MDRATEVGTHVHVPVTDVRAECPRPGIGGEIPGVGASEAHIVDERGI